MINILKSQRESIIIFYSLEQRICSKLKLIKYMKIIIPEYQMKNKSNCILKLTLVFTCFVSTTLLET